MGFRFYGLGIRVLGIRVLGLGLGFRVRKNPTLIVKAPVLSSSQLQRLQRRWVLSGGVTFGDLRLRSVCWFRDTGAP